MGSNNKITASIEALSLDRMEEQMSHNTGNRPLSEATVARYAGTMARGEWETNGEPIIVADDGTILDGQHRLAAALRAKMVLTALVVRGVPRKTFDTIDIGIVRTTAHVLHIKGEKQSKILASALRFQSGWDVGLRSACLHTKATPRMCEATLEAHPDIRDSVDWICRHAGLGRFLPMGQIAFLLHNATRSHGFTKAAKFWDSVDTGASLSFDHPALLLRDRLSQEGLVHGRAPTKRTAPSAKLAIAIKAWNAYVTSGRMLQLKWSAKEDFPEFAQP